MATNGNNLEPAFEALLKSHVQQHGTSRDATCAQFDPETANAYLERALTPNALAAYEEHLANCAACRRHIVRLAQFVPAPATLLNTALSVEQLSLRERLSGWWTSWRLGALVGLGAVTATALLLVVLVNRATQNTALVAVNSKEQVAQAPAAVSLPPSTPSLPGVAENQVSGTAKTSASATPAAATKERPAAVITPASPTEFKADAAPPAPPPPAPLAAAPQAQQGQQSASVNRVEDLARAQNPQRNVQFPLKGPAETQAERNERAKQESYAPASGAAVPKPAEKTVEKERKDATPAVATARAAELADKKSAEADEGRNAVKGKAPSKAREAPTKPEPTPYPSRTVNNKRFLFQNGLWTDTAYDAGANLPVIRLQTNSDAYNQTVRNLPALEPYFDLAPVLVVWQGKVYRVEKR